MSGGFGPSGDPVPVASVLPVSGAGGSCLVANVQVEFVSVASVRTRIQYHSLHQNLATTHRFDSGIKAQSGAIFQHFVFLYQSGINRLVFYHQYGKQNVVFVFGCAYGAGMCLLRSLKKLSPPSLLRGYV